jgi:hypothetical protein
MYTTFCNFLCITVWHIYKKKQSKSSFYPYWVSDICIRFSESNESLKITRLCNPIVCSGLFLKQTQAYIYIRLIASGIDKIHNCPKCLKEKHFMYFFYIWMIMRTVFLNTLYTCRIGMIPYMDMVRLIKFNHIRVGKTICCTLGVGPFLCMHCGGKWCSS